MNFEKWILNFLAEQNIDITTVVDVERNIHIGHVVNHLVNGDHGQQVRVRDMLLLAINNNGSVKGYFEHLANGMTTKSGAAA
jgi:hypothetical protein